ncbi:peroxisome biogenesis factor 13 [Arapaima gigas]
MASQPPLKPWEKRAPGVIPVPANYRSVEFGPAGPSRPRPPVLTRIAPPVPPRPAQQSGGTMSAYRPGYSSFTSAYSPYSSSLFGGYSPYGYGGYGVGGSLGYGRFRLEDAPPSRFVQQAEESSRGAFQSIESIVHAFSSVSMMLDATFSAVYNSFRAVLDVANHFSRLRVHFTKVLSAFALVRSLRFLYRRLQRMLGLRRDSEADDLWAESSGSAVAARGFGTEDPAASSVKSWPIFLFFAVILGGPYLIWKLLSSSESPEETATNWASGDDDHVVARAEFDFTAVSEEEISIQTGDMLNLAPKEQQPRIRGWVLASLDGQSTGLVPANYVRVLGRRRGRRHVEQERLEQQPVVQSPQPRPAAATGPADVSLPLADSEETFESVYREAPGQSGMDSFPSTSSSNTTVLPVPEKVDL